MADSLLMNEVQKHVIIKVEAQWATTKTFFKMNWIENKNALLAFFKTKNDCSFFYKITIFEKALLRESILKFISSIPVFQNNQIFSFRSVLISANDRGKTVKIDYI